MTAGRVRRLQFAAACGLIAGYAVLFHYCNSVGARAPGAALAIAPAAIMALVASWRCAPITAPFAACAVVALGYAAWPILERHFSLIGLVQDTFVYALLAASFGRSLLPDRTALCTRLADRVHGPLSALEVRYTRHVTVAWTVFFAGVAVVSILLYSFAPLQLWSVYVNFCVLPLVGAMFLGEQLTRRRALPPAPRAGLLATLRVFLAAPR
ncbi:MAG: hypothetical protein NVSMB10_03400 [Steroidobacteraceae bacterium]